MRTSLLLVLMIALTSPAAAKTLKFDLRNGPGVALVDVDVEEAGVVHDGGPTGPTFETGRGEKTFRAVIAADVLVYDQELAIHRNYYSRFQRRESGQNNYGIFHVYRIRDVVRFPINVVNGGTIDFAIHFQASVPGLTFEDSGGEVYSVDRVTRLGDRQDLGIIPPALPDNNSTAPGSVCLEQRPNPTNPIIMECVRWGPRQNTIP
jgi:hypothetical protein